MINDIVFLLRRPRESGDPDSIFYNKNFAWPAIRLVRRSHIGRSMDSRSSREWRGVNTFNTIDLDGRLEYLHYISSLLGVLRYLFNVEFMGFLNSFLILYWFYSIDWVILLSALSKII